MSSRLYRNIGNLIKTEWINMPRVRHAGTYFILLSCNTHLKNKLKFCAMD